MRSLVIFLFVLLFSLSSFGFTAQPNVIYEANITDNIMRTTLLQLRLTTRPGHGWESLYQLQFTEHYTITQPIKNCYVAYVKKTAELPVTLRLYDADCKNFFKMGDDDDNEFITINESDYFRIKGSFTGVSVDKIEWILPL